jgi:hypothetical protein
LTGIVFADFRQSFLVIGPLLVPVLFVTGIIIWDVYFSPYTRGVLLPASWNDGRSKLVCNPAGIFCLSG